MPNTTPPPPRYGELARFFPTPDARARALGVTRRLVAALDRGEEVSAGALPTRRLNVVLDAARAVEGRDGGPEEAGAWLLGADEGTGQARIDAVRRTGRLPG